eukprot:427653_1
MTSANHSRNVSASMISISEMNDPNYDNQDESMQHNDNDVDEELTNILKNIPFENEIFKWSMTETQLEAIKSCEEAEKFVSDTFKINDALFALILYPNKETSKCILYLKLLQLPSNVNGMVVNVVTKCEPLTVSNSSIFDVSYTADKSSKLLKLSFDAFKEHQFTNIETCNVFECDVKVLRVYENKDIILTKKIHQFEWNLKEFEVQYFVNSNDGALYFKVNTADIQWTLGLEWSDDEKKSSEYANVTIRKLDMPARIWIYCDQVMCGAIRHESFKKNRYYPSLSEKALSKSRFSGLNHVKICGFIELLGDNVVNNVFHNNIKFNGQDEWNVSETVMKVFKNAKVDEPFWSPPFTIGDCIWLLVLYPRIKDNYVGIQLILLQMPSNAHQVIVRVDFKLNMIDGCEFMHKFNYDKDRIRYRTISTDVFNTFESLNIITCIEIISINDELGIHIVDKEEKKDELCDIPEHDCPNNFELKLQHDELEIFFDTQLSEKKYTVFRYPWLQGIKWKFVCYPKGEEDSCYESTLGFTLAYLFPLEFPSNISAVKCRYWILCNDGLYGRAGVYLFKKGKTGKGWGKNLHHSRFEQLREPNQQKSVNFVFHIEILESFSAKDENTNVSGELELSDLPPCKNCEVLRLKNVELYTIQKNMFGEMDKLLNEPNKVSQENDEGLFDTQQQMIVDSWVDKLSKLQDVKKHFKEEIKSLKMQNQQHKQENDNLRKTVQELQNQMEPTKEETETLQSKMETLETENMKLKLKTETVDEVEMKTDNNNDEQQELIQQLLDENVRLQQKYNQFEMETKTKQDKLQKELTEKDKTIKTLSNLYNSLKKKAKSDAYDDQKETDKLKLFLSSDQYKVNLIDYYDAFKNEGFDDLDVFCDLTDDDLKNDIGISKKAHRMKILRGITLLSINNNGNVNNVINNKEGNHSSFTQTKLYQ